RASSCPIPGGGMTPAACSRPTTPGCGPGRSGFWSGTSRQRMPKMQRRMRNVAYENILVYREGAVGRVQLNRPQALNALNFRLMTELVEAFRELERDPGVGCLLLHGNERAFAAGADIKEMADLGAIDMYTRDYIERWDEVARIRK